MHSRKQSCMQNLTRRARVKHDRGRAERGLHDDPPRTPKTLDPGRAERGLHPLTPGPQGPCWKNRTETHKDTRPYMYALTNEKARTLKNKYVHKHMHTFSESQRCFCANSHAHRSTKTHSRKQSHAQTYSKKQRNPTRRTCVKHARPLRKSGASRSLVRSGLGRNIW